MVSWTEKATTGLWKKQEYTRHFPAENSDILVTLFGMNASKKMSCKELYSGTE